jgi:hypothetical protein
VGKRRHILWPFGTSYGHLGYFMTFCVPLRHFSGFGIMYQEKSGNPGPETIHFGLIFFTNDKVAHIFGLLLTTLMIIRRF